MSWQDPNSPWAKTIIRRMRWQLFSAAITVPLILVIPFGIMAWSGVQIPWTALRWAVLPMIFFALVTGLQYWMLRRVRILVPRHDGLVCPRCRVPLDMQDQKAACPKCRRQYVAEVVRAYWEQFAFSPVSLATWVRKGQLAVPTEGVQRVWTRSRFIICMASIVGFPLVVIVFAVSVLHIGVLEAMLFTSNAVLSAITAVVGAFLIARSRQRVGKSRHCASCGYQKSPDTTNPERCPECGAPWSALGATVHGQRTGRPWMVWTGVAVLVLGVPLSLFGFGPTPLGCGIQEYLPNSALIHVVTNSRIFTYREWAALGRRSLSPAEKATLAAGLLDRRPAGGGMDMQGEQWLGREVSAGTLPPQLIQRYYHEMIKLWIEAPAEARVGEAVDLSLGCESFGHSSGLPVGVYDMVYVAGFYVGDATEPLDRRNTPQYASLLDTTDRSGLGRQRMDHPPTQVTPTRPGPLRIRLVAWFVVGPSAVSGTVQWLPDGTPTIPSAAVWSERIEVEHIIQVHD